MKNPARQRGFGAKHEWGNVGSVCRPLLAALAVTACAARGNGEGDVSDPGRRAATLETSDELSRPGRGSVVMLYYSGKGPKRGIGLATSSDGVTYARHPANPVFTVGKDGAFDAVGVTDPSVVIHDGVFYLYYTGKNAAGLEQIGVATSPDGVRFERRLDGPAIAAGPEEWDATKASDPSVVVHEGRFFCLYSSQPKGGPELTSMATSPDGLVWAKHPGGPVLEDGHDPSLVRIRTAGRDPWAVYFALEGRVVVSSSQDLESFAGPPRTVLEPAPGGYFARGLADVELVVASEDGFPRDHLFFGAEGVEGARSIGLARSVDGMTFAALPEPILVPDARTYPFEGRIISDPAVVVVER